MAHQQNRGDEKSRKRLPVKNQAVLDAEVRKLQLILQTVRVCFITVAFPLSVLALWPTAYVLAGRETVVDATIAISVSVTLAITTACTGGLAYQQAKRANKARSRIAELNSQLQIAQAELASAQTMVSGLRSDLEGVRRDRELSGKRRT
ncbi:hypothetical protein [Mycolicibacterium mageritense]|uniref:Uncharacterized protein n=1 Tax=Mycolicibacterium mageritense TaxID=53462 RepID=A0AAI8XR01_MYCME|nr:hypothetical protein [Mycolicibacterium mageritense]BDY31438.1 hypothetical protein hbim_05390 [Mycolicibacterium mageritense]